MPRYLSFKDLIGLSDSTVYRIPDLPDQKPAFWDDGRWHELSYGRDVFLDWIENYVDVPNPDVTAFTGCPTQSLGFLISAIRCGEQFGDEHEAAADHVRRSLEVLDCRPLHLLLGSIEDNDLGDGGYTWDLAVSFMNYRDHQTAHPACPATT